jgi:hypothetical protein
MGISGVQWQEEADCVVAESESAVLRLLRPRIIIDRKTGTLIRSRPFRSIFIPMELCDCPPDVRQYILLHEMGHFRYLHAYSLLPFLYLFIAALVNLPPFYWMNAQSAELLARCLFVLFVVFAFAYAGFLFPPYFEGAADDHAVKVMGKEQVLKAMQWLIREIGKIGTPRSQKWRLDRLR